MYLTTEDQGLWYSSNRRSAYPTFTQLNGYPFLFPTRVFFNPYNTNEIWVTSYGNGMRLGRINEPQPSLTLQRTEPASLVGITAALGQRIVLSASPDLNTWSPIATNVMFTGQVSVNETSSVPARFFRAQVR
jgi:hypothetical protein